MQNELSIFNPQNIDNLPMTTRWPFSRSFVWFNPA